MKKNPNNQGLNRREFLRRGTSAASLMMLMGSVPLRAAETSTNVVTHYKGETPPLKVGVIGCGAWGREILRTLSLIPFGPVVAICEIYPPYLRRAGRLAREAKQYTDYRKLLEDDNVEGVIVATPTHQHKQIVLDALKAGKHVYCEAPMAMTIEDAKEIAAAARDAIELNFQVGLQNRCDRQIVNLDLHVIKNGYLGDHIKCYAQYHQRTSWRRTSPNPEQEKKINWRLRSQTSLGLVGEIGIHQIDIANWFYRKLPVAVRGFGSIVTWKDGRDVPDNVVAILEYPNGVFMDYQATLGNSFNQIKQVFYGSYSAILMRDRRAWMFKEADAPLFGFEVYANKQMFYTESGLVLGAGSTTQEAHEKAATPGGNVVDPKSALQYSLEHFLINSYNHGAAVQDFREAFGDAADRESLKQYLQDLEETRQPAAGYLEGLQATVTVIRANEAIRTGKRIQFREDDFKL